MKCVVIKFGDMIMVCMFMGILMFLDIDIVILMLDDCGLIMLILFIGMFRMWIWLLG